MKLLALDQSSRISGFAVFEDGKLLDYGHFTFTDKDFGERLMNIKNKVKELIEKYKVDEVIFEDIQLKNGAGNNVLTFKNTSLYLWKSFLVKFIIPNNGVASLFSPNNLLYNLIISPLP